MNHRLFTFFIFIGYLILMTGVMIWQGIGIAPDRYALVLLFGSLLIRKTREFLFDWIPFLSILIAYDFLRGFADNLTPRVDYQSLIDAELWLFNGVLPTVYLQQLWFINGQIGLIDYFFTILYFLHFALPLSFGYLLWLYNRSHFRVFITGILLLSYGAFISFILYPAAPPWLAQEKGMIEGVTKIIDLTLKSFPDRLALPTIYHQFNPNPVAAMPSLHAAYPLLILLFCLKFFGQKGWWFLPYVIATWVSIVYLGEHYVVDVIGGGIFAVIFYKVAIQVHNNVKLQAWLKARLAWAKKKEK